MVKIRLTRMGRRNRPYYRLVVVDSRKRRDSAYIDCLGFYDPIKENPLEINGESFNVEKAVEWIMKGAQPTDTARSILKRYGVMKKVDELKYRNKKENQSE